MALLVKYISCQYFEMLPFMKFVELNSGLKLFLYPWTIPLILDLWELLKSLEKNIKQNFIY